MASVDEGTAPAARFGADLAFNALADPTRREILAVLADVDECSVGALADAVTSVGRTAISTHLKVLRLAGLVTERRAGKYRFYSVDATGSAAEVMNLLSDLFKSSLRDARSAIERHEPDSVVGAEAG